MPVQGEVMVPGDEKPEVSLSSEFFKKLNQQIVQKDNLIKLLQLQIKNLKSQVDEGTSDGAKKGELSKTLETKEGEIKKLASELSQAKGVLEKSLKEKDEQINSLNRLIEEHKKTSETAAAEHADDPRVPELEAGLAKMGSELEAERKKSLEVQAQLEALHQDLEGTKALALEVESLRAKTGEMEVLRAKATELERNLAEAGTLDSRNLQLEAELADAKAQLAQASASIPSQDLQSRTTELEQDVITLKSLLAEKDEQIAAMSSQQLPPPPDPALETTRAELEGLRVRNQELEVKASRVADLEAALAKSTGDAGEVAALQMRITELETESANLSESAIKLTLIEDERKKLESEREAALSELGNLKASMGSHANEVADLNAKVEEAQKKLAQCEKELNELRVSVDSQRGQGGVLDVATKAEVEQLTSQVADQLLALQRFERGLRENQEKLVAKEEEISQLRQRVIEAESSPRAVQISAESEVVANFIDFFESLDAILAHNPNAELQSLHRKLLDRLIIPNKIQYMPVIAETFDQARHVATDFFRSDKFPERCIVFEVEKGYRQGDMVVKKAKVWVVQNLFECPGCNVMQSQEDSRFCHKCGSRITAPNALPIESIPVFQPTSNTYLRFAERMTEINKIDRAREYLEEALRLDNNFVPGLVKLADVHAGASEFPVAINYLKRAALLKPELKIADRIRDLEVRNSIYQQARNLNLPPEEFEKLISLIQK